MNEYGRIEYFLIADQRPVQEFVVQIDTSWPVDGFYVIRQRGY